jgi:hypothetical protein
MHGLVAGGPNDPVGRRGENGDGGHSWRHAAFTGSEPGVEGWVGVTFVSPTKAVASPWTLNGSALAITTDTARTWQSITFPSGR